YLQHTRIGFPIPSRRRSRGLTRISDFSPPRSNPAPPVKHLPPKVRLHEPPEAPVKDRMCQTVEQARLQTGHRFLDKGKPSARVGRKAMGPSGIARLPKG